MDPQQLRRPVLKPGLRFFRRDDGHLQVGIDDPDPRVVLPDSAGVRELLRQLERGEGLRSLTPDAGLCLARLVDAEAVVEHDEVLAAHDDRQGFRAAALGAHGPDAAWRLSARATCRVTVDAPTPWRSVAADRLASMGLATATAGSRSTVTLLVAAGEPPRSQVDALVRDDRAHLLVTLFPGRARLGPLVVPGRTACLRCLDAHLGESDTRRAVVLEQLEPGPASSPCDPALAQAALALAARELATYAEGDRPATWSATLTLDAELGHPVRAWPRHPHCGCSWG